MSKTLISILCDEETWAWDNHTCTIAFNENGTGELRSQRELNVWIAAEFDWKLQSTSHFDESININSIEQTRKNPTRHLISQFDIEITLAKRCILSLRSCLGQARLLAERSNTPRRGLSTLNIQRQAREGQFPMPV